MAENLGKKFEKRFALDWCKSFPDCFFLRLPDQQSGYFGTSRNICDFITFTGTKLFLIECKSIRKNTFPLTNFTQYDKLKQFKHIKNVNIGVILWFIDHDAIVYVPISTYEQIRDARLKSINIKMLNDNKYKLIPIPAIKKIKFLVADYSILADLED